jgi:hypothetical protein
MFSAQNHCGRVLLCYASQQLSDLYAGPEELKLYLPHFTYPVYDFSHLGDEEIRGKTELQINLLILHHIFDGRLAEKLPEIFALYRVLENQEKALQPLAAVLRYLTVTAERVTPEQMRQALEPVLRYEGDELMSTLAQQWLEQGRQEGWQKGLQQGLWAMRQNIIDLLADRWQIPAQRFQDRLRVIENMETLRLLVRLVATVDGCGRI